MDKLLERLRSFFSRCKHDWAFVKMTKLNEFIDSDPEILSSREYSLQRCTLCGKEKYRRL